jgi:hypothetical protein
MTKSELLARVPPLYRLARAVKESRRPDDHRDAPKRLLLRDTARAHGLRVLIETGTYMGETAWALRREFERVETIELEPTLARLAEIRFRGTPTVHVHAGDSAALLPRILETLTEPALFWLDAHPSTDRTAHGAIPLRRELAAIAAHPIRGHAVLVDDLQYLGEGEYPRLEELELPGYSLDTVGSVARLRPVTRS